MSIKIIQTVIGSLVLSNIILSGICFGEENRGIALDDLVRTANLVLADADNVRASKEAGKVFAAAHALKARSAQESAFFFAGALRLAPWRLEEQLAYAEVLVELDQKKQAEEIAEMVVIRSESDDLTHKAMTLLGNKVAPIHPAIPPSEGPWICLVRVGEVNEVALQASLTKLTEVLGIPVVIFERSVPLGEPNRSALDRWTTEILIKQLNWLAPELKVALQSKGVNTPAKLASIDVIKIAREAISKSESVEQLKQFEEAVAFLQGHNKQWDAEKLMEQSLIVTEDFKNIEEAIILGITEADIYSQESNFVFGLALNGGRKGLVSYSRYRADFTEEPPHLSRLTQRMHKQMLSTVGNALGVARPTDPTSARAYPKDLAEHDAKSEFMSELCITGFENALRRKLPQIAHKP